jgi:hypothetical protein
MAVKGASLDQLRDYCNNNGIPGRRKAFWSTSTWQSILQPSILLQYAGYGVWNVHRKNGTKRPSDEWVVVPNARPQAKVEELRISMKNLQKVIAKGNPAKIKRIKRIIHSCPR